MLKIKFYEKVNWINLNIVLMRQWWHSKWQKFKYSKDGWNELKNEELIHKENPKIDIRVSDYMSIGKTKVNTISSPNNITPLTSTKIKIPGWGISKDQEGSVLKGLQEREIRILVLPSKVENVACQSTSFHISACVSYVQLQMSIL